jgi:hypothetical protein
LLEDALALTGLLAKMAHAAAAMAVQGRDEAAGHDHTFALFHALFAFQDSPALSFTPDVEKETPAPSPGVQMVEAAPPPATTAPPAAKTAPAPRSLAAVLRGAWLKVRESVRLVFDSRRKLATVAAAMGASSEALPQGAKMSAEEWRLLELHVLLDEFLKELFAILHVRVLAFFSLALALASAVFAPFIFILLFTSFFDMLCCCC